MGACPGRRLVANGGEAGGTARWRASHGGGQGEGPLHSGPGCCGCHIRTQQVAERGCGHCGHGGA
eukprot:3772681-Alexandrium_andersonii.AAC.1